MWYLVTFLVIALMSCGYKYYLLKKKMKKLKEDCDEYLGIGC
jgi:hypothetical protein